MPAPPVDNSEPNTEATDVDLHGDHSQAAQTSNSQQTERAKAKKGCEMASEGGKCGVERQLKRKIRKALGTGVAKTGVFFEKRLKIGGCEHKLLRLLSRTLGIWPSHLRGVSFETGSVAGVPVRFYWPADGGGKSGWKDTFLKMVHRKRKPSAAGRYSLPAVTASSKQPGLGCIVYFHGGGFCLSSAKACHKTTSRICQQTGAVVISVDYRLAPEHSFPAGLDDCCAVARALLDDATVDASIPNLDRNRVILAGAGAGGTYAVATALDLIRRPARRALHALMAVSPPLQAFTSRQLASYDQKRCAYVGGSPLTSYEAAWSLPRLAGVSATKEVCAAIRGDAHLPREDYERLIRSVFPGLSPCPIGPAAPSNVPQLSDLASDVRAWPLLADDQDLAQLPLTLLQSCDHDRLFDEGTRFAERCLTNMSPDRFMHQVISHAQHSESTSSVGSKTAKTALGNALDFLRAALARQPDLVYAEASQGEDSFREAAVDVHMEAAVDDIVPRILA